MASSSRLEREVPSWCGGRRCLALIYLNPAPVLRGKQEGVLVGKYHRESTDGGLGTRDDETRHRAHRVMKRWFVLEG